MGSEELFNASKAVFKMFGDFFNDVAQEIGIEKAIALYARRGDRGGASLVETLKEHAERGAVNIDKIAENYSNFYKALGFSLEPEVGPEKWSFRVSRCPRYDGFLEAGIDHETIKTICQANAGANNKKLKSYNPEASVKVQVRSAKIGTCIEEFHIPK